LQQQLSTAVTSFLRGPQIDLLGCVRALESGREQAQDAATHVRLFNADLVRLCEATKSLNAWNQSVTRPAVS
jgi:hypothetical protein